MAVPLLADVNGGQLATDSVAKTLTAVKLLGDVHVLVACPAAATEAADLAGMAMCCEGHRVAMGVFVSNLWKKGGECRRDAAQGSRASVLVGGQPPAASA